MGEMIPWYDDPAEVAVFARWFFDMSATRPSEVIDLFEKPWKWTEEYESWKNE